MCWCVINISAWRHSDSITLTDPVTNLSYTCTLPCRQTHAKSSRAPLHSVAYRNAVASKSIFAKGERVCVCMCMDAHVPSHWDICGNSESAVMAKLAIKLCQGRDPSEGCNVYHWTLAPAICPGIPYFSGRAEIMLLWRTGTFWLSLSLCPAFLLLCHSSLMQSVIYAQVCIYCTSSP